MTRRGTSRTGDLRRSVRGPVDRRAVSELAEALDLGRVDGRETALVARLVAARPALDGHAPLSEQTRQAQRARLVAVATVRPPSPTPATPPTARPAARRRRAALALASVAAVLGLGGVAAAASQSLPGDPFYDVKLGTESVQLALSFGDQSRGEQHLEMATTRLQEVRGLVEGRASLDATAATPVAGAGTAVTAVRATRVTDTLVSMDDSTRSGSALLTDLYRSDRNAVPLRTLEKWAQGQRKQLNALLPRLDATARDQASSSLALLRTVDDEATALMTTGSCPGGCDPGAQVPGATTEPSRPPAPGRPGVPVTPRPTPSAGPPAAPGPTPSAGPPASPSLRPSAPERSGPVPSLPSAEPVAPGGEPAPAVPGSASLPTQDPGIPRPSVTAPPLPSGPVVPLPSELPPTLPPSLPGVSGGS